MHVLFLAPDTHVYNHAFVRALTAEGARVSAIGPGPHAKLPPALNSMLAGYRSCDRLLDAEPLLACARELGKQHGIDRVETIDEPLVEPAAQLRARLQLPGLSVETARICRDKVAMKDVLRRAGIPCAQAAAATTAAEVHAFAEREGYPIIVKPIAGYGSLDTHRVESKADLATLLDKLKPGDGRRLAVEEFVEGHEGFYDTMIDDGGVRYDFAAHYYPGCLEASLHRWISPQIAVTNRIEGEGYGELRDVGRRVIEALGLRNCATHMEWFFGPKGLKFSEIGARPAGEKIWDMYGVANEFDVYREWARALLGRPSLERPTRRYAAGSIQIRPDRDGRVHAHTGVEAAFARCREFVYEHSLPKVGAPTQPLTKGWYVNTWFRLKHPDYDELRRLMTLIGETVKTTAR